jgi:thiol-disulfide isomerase/thioredoxin
MPAFANLTYQSTQFRIGELMPLTSSFMPELGMAFPEWELPDVVTGTPVSSKSFCNRPVLVMFLCNHCPFSRYVEQEVARIAKEYQSRGVAMVAISASDIGQHPEDAPANLKEMARRAGFDFPFCYDESQSTPKAFCAACTPEFFVYDPNGTLVYRGQMDDSRLGSPTPITGRDLREALNAVVEERSVNPVQKPSVGCNIKWKHGNEPTYTRATATSHA